MEVRADATATAAAPVAPEVGEPEHHRVGALLGYLRARYREAPRKRLLLRTLALQLRGADRLITSADGTTIAARSSGAGVPLVLVHGTTAGIDSFSFVEPILAQRSAVWVYDRRGRGRSGDASDYGLDREVDDLAAVLDAVGAPAHVLGHSYGGVIAHLAAARGVPMRSLAIYEPPLTQDRVPAATLDAVCAAVARGEHEAALRRFLVEVAGATPGEVAVVSALRPIWRALRDGVRTAPREIDALRSLAWRPGAIPLTGLPTLLLAGELTQSLVYPSPDELRRSLPHAEVAALAGQGHMATGFAPVAFAAAVEAFIGDGR